ncbi:MAG: Rrf2 family transcriptional regulator [Treponema sp.]|nr:Rrf2 family transcriptional regulator [Treponema sp.]MBP5752902.1 Rrf2 family transcriptional regulator [Treponema sp.]
MYKISTRGQYALLIMEDLAMGEADKYIPLKLLSHRHNLSIKYLEQILIQLGKSGLVNGSRGTSGGYRLARPPHEYTIGEILRAMEGELCPLTSFEKNTVVSEGSRFFWQDFEATINNFVDSVHLDDLAEKDKAYVGYDYSI